jgi:long-chain acyl-CoA synthetase
VSEATAHPNGEPPPRLETLADLPFHLLGRHPKPLLVGQVRGTNIVGESTRDWFDKLRDVALGLEALGVAPGDRVVIMSESRPEWLVSDLAILAIGGVTVPVYSTLAAGQARYIVQDAGARVALVSTAEQLDKLQSVRHQLPGLQAVIVFDPSPVSSPSVFPFESLIDRGHRRMMSEWGVARVLHDRARAVRPDQLATIIYTSGTAGEPKGVMLSHRNIVSNMDAGYAMVPVNDTDVALSFLPLSHAFERTVSFVCLAHGVTIVYAESMDTIGRDLSIVRPTVMTGVPRVYEKFEARVIDRGNALPQPRRALFNWGLRVAGARARADTSGRGTHGLLALQVALADRLVFSKVRENVGGRLRILVSGSAPLAASTAEFFHGIGLGITEGYGLTEAAPIVTANPLGAAKLGTVGKPVPGVEIRIDDDGEILARGPNIMLGYYNRPQDTAEVIRDGWLHTGDVGSIDGDGYLTITDRKKDLIVTSGGKKIAPQPIEAVLKRSPLIAEAMVLGDRHRFVAALIVPDFAALERRLQDLGRPPEHGPDAHQDPDPHRDPDPRHGSPARAALVLRPDVLALYQEIVDGLNRDLSQFERIKKIRVLPREFSIASGELTPTMKVKRKVVEKRWAREIAEMYGESPGDSART